MHCARSTCTCAKASSSPSPARRVPARPPSSTSPACSNVQRRRIQARRRGRARPVRRRALALRNQKIGFIFQSFNLIPDLNLFDNVDVPLRYRGMPAAERKQRIEDALARSGWVRA
jgi:ABC-type histidine transport system ATPase subunit